MIIINTTIGIIICNANNASPNSISNIKKSVVNIHPTIQTRSDKTIIVDKNDINPLIYYKYNKITIYILYGDAVNIDIQSSCDFFCITYHSASYHLVSSQKL